VAKKKCFDIQKPVEKGALAIKVNGTVVKKKMLNQVTV
jgi:hypothetical protein